MDITKDEILEALKEGRITCNLKGDVDSFTPQDARDLLLSNIDRFFDPKYNIDLSFEDKYSNLLG